MRNSPSICLNSLTCAQALPADARHRPEMSRFLSPQEPATPKALSRHKKDLRSVPHTTKKLSAEHSCFSRRLNQSLPAPGSNNSHSLNRHNDSKSNDSEVHWGSPAGYSRTPAPAPSPAVSKPSRDSCRARGEVLDSGGSGQKQSNSDLCSQSDASRLKKIRPTGVELCPSLRPINTLEKAKI